MESADEPQRQSWEFFLDPEVMRPVLISAAIYVAAFESLERSIIERVIEAYGGFADPPDLNNLIDKTTREYIRVFASEHVKYKEEVLSRNSNHRDASLAWLCENGAITYADIASFDRIRTCRNHLAHRMLSFLGNEGLPPNFQQCFKEMVELLRKIELWWIVGVETPCNPEFDKQDIDVDSIVPGKIMALQLLCDIALGSEEKSKYYYNEMKKRHKKKDQRDQEGEDANS